MGSGFLIDQPNHFYCRETMDLEAVRWTDIKGGALTSLRA
jgi:hypothetical protein